MNIYAKCPVTIMDILLESEDTHGSQQFTYFILPYSKAKSYLFVGWQVIQGASLILHFHVFIGTIVYAQKHLLHNWSLPADCSVKENVQWLEGKEDFIQDYCGRREIELNSLETKVGEFVSAG